MNHIERTNAAAGFSPRLRRFIHPILLKYWLRHSSRVLTTRVGGFTLRVLPTVFHPKYFGSSLILGRYVESQSLQGKTFLDMGTGSGIIGLCAARAGARVTGVDINPSAVECALQNSANAGFEIEYLRSDLFSGLPNRRFDVIAWNPPFFPKPSENLAEAALYAGPRFGEIARFAGSCREHMTSDAHIILVLSLDIDVVAVESRFRNEGFSARRVLTRKWGFAETMIIVEIR